MPKREHVDFITSHLDGQAKNEVRFYAPAERDDSVKIFKILREAFGEKRSTPQLFKQFYDRKQRDGETLRLFSHALLELIELVAQKCPEAVTNKDQVLRDHFADNVKDSLLRKELRRMIHEHPAVQFMDVREEAIRWSEEEEKVTSKKTATTSEISRSTLSEPQAQATVQNTSGNTDPVMLEVFKTLQEQQKVLQEMTTTMKSFQSSGAGKNQNRKPLRYTNDGKPICYRCDGAGHVGQNCPQKKPKQDAAKSSTDSLNENHLSL